MTREEKQYFWILSYSDAYIKKCYNYLALCRNAKIGISFGETNAAEPYYEYFRDALFESAVTAYGNIFSNHDGINRSTQKSFIDKIEQSLPTNLKNFHQNILIARDTFVCHSDHNLHAQNASNLSTPALKVIRERKDNYSFFSTTEPLPPQELIISFCSLVDHVRKFIDAEVTTSRKVFSEINPEMNSCYLDTTDGINVWVQDFGPDWNTLSKP